MKNLQNLDFIRYDSTNGTGTVLLWVRQSIKDMPPTAPQIRGRMAITLISPDNKKITIKRGLIADFCKRNNLNRRAIYDVLEGLRPQYKGWTA